MPENKFLKDALLTPNKLKLEGDSVRFTVKGTIPLESKFLQKNLKVSLAFKGEQSKLDLGEFDLKKNVEGYTYENKFTLKYEPWMAGATLEVSFFQGKKDNLSLTEKKVLAKGVMTPQLMVKLGAVYPDEPIPEVGMYMTSGLFDKEVVRVKEFSIRFDIGSSIYNESPDNLQEIKDMEAFISANPGVQEVKITGLQSPEAGEGKSSILGMDRAESARRVLVSHFSNLTDLKMKVDSRWNDWFDLRLLLGDYNGISNNRKDELYAVLMNQEPYLDQSEQLKRVVGFTQVAQDLFPKLRVAKIEISAKPRMGLDIQQSIKLKESLTSSDGTNDLSFEEWALAAEASQSLEEKAVIYSTMTKFFRSELPYNNMAVVRMRQAQRTLDQQSKEILWEEAQRLLTQAYRIEANPYTIHNQGQILALQGRFWDSYLKLSEASTLNQNPDFLKQNEALKGALDILRGDYKLATLRFQYKFSDPKDYFNKGLAYYLIGDYVNATTAFEESVILGRSFGYGFYGLAMIAAASGQEGVALIHLKKAIESNRQLSNMAFLDPVFEELRESEEFITEIQSN